MSIGLVSLNYHCGRQGTVNLKSMPCVFHQSFFTKTPCYNIMYFVTQPSRFGRQQSHHSVSRTPSHNLSVLSVLQLMPFATHLSLRSAIVIFGCYLTSFLSLCYTMLSFVTQ